jgi:hypothetical protein
MVKRGYSAQDEIILSVSEAGNAAASPDDMVLITASFYTVGKVRLPDASSLSRSAVM